MLCLKSPPFLPQSVTGLQSIVPLNDLINSDMIDVKMITSVHEFLISSAEVAKSRAKSVYDQFTKGRPLQSINRSMTFGISYRGTPAFNFLGIIVKIKMF